MDDSSQIHIPPDDSNWEKNKCKLWPKLTYEDIVDYLILSKAYDGKAMKAFRAMYGYNYVQNGWMGDIFYVKLNDIHFLKANVSPSQPGVGRADYFSWVAISNNCIVLTGHCTCPAGNGKSCSHISAVLYAVTLAWSSGVGGTTCTDESQAWGRGASKSLTHEKLVDITFNRPSAQTLKRPRENENVLSNDTTPITNQYLDHKDLEESVQRSAVKSLWECKGTLLYQLLHAPEQKPVEINDIMHGSHDIDQTSPVTYNLPCINCEHFCQKYVRLSSENIGLLTSKTENQDSNLWLETRKLRITASKANSVPKSNRADPSKFVNNQLYSRFKGNAATQHGKRNEPKAIEWFQQVTGVPVTKSGIVVCPEEPYFAASPDGIVDENTIIEIKCPTRPLQDLISSGKYDVMLRDGQPFLNPKGSNGYYCQVQMTMFCTKTKLCKFVVWTSEHKHIIDVPFSLEYISGLLPRLRKFYFEHLLVRLTDEHHYNRLRVSKDYLGLCNIPN